jgi:uncharacterized protein
VTYLYLALAGFIAWIVSTLAAGGGALLLVPIVTFLLGAAAVAPVVTLTTLIAEPGRVWLFRERIRWEVVRWYLPGSVPGALLGAWLFARAEAEWLQIILAIFLLSTLVQYRFGKKERSFPMRRGWFLPLGAGVSFFSGLIGTMGPVLNPFYMNYGVEKEELIATKSFNSLVMHVAKVSTYTFFGALTGPLFLYGMVAGVAAMAANWIGKRTLERLSSARFQQLVIAMMVISGAVMLWEQRALILAWIGGR